VTFHLRHASNRFGLRRRFFWSARHPSAHPLALHAKPIVIECATEIQHCSNELRLAIPCSADHRADRPTPLIGGIALARRWYEHIVANEVFRLEQIARRIGKTPAYVSNASEFASLSPATVEDLLRESNVSKQEARGALKGPELCADLGEQVTPRHSLSNHGCRMLRPRFSEFAPRLLGAELRECRPDRRPTVLQNSTSGIA
jgi:hypothetical protein